MAFSVSGSLASETETPSLTSAAACFRFAGVMRFIVPISSSLPQRPQFDKSFFHCSYWAVVTLWSVDPRVCESMVLDPTATIAGSTQNATVSLLVIDPSSCGGLYGRGAAVDDASDVVVPCSPQKSRSSRHAPRLRRLVTRDLPGS